MTISKLSRLSGVSRGYIHLIEKGANNPTWDKLQSIADALGVPFGFDMRPRRALSESLQEFVNQYRVPFADIDMLIHINYRGNQPTSVVAWKLLYAMIKSASTPPVGKDT